MGRPPTNPYLAYAQAQGTGVAARHAEAQAFLRVADRLEAARAARPIDVAVFEDALRHNQRLWTAVRLEVEAEGNRLPAPVRANLVRLSHFVDRQTTKALVSRDPVDVRPLVDVDREIAQGLLDR